MTWSPKPVVQDKEEMDDAIAEEELDLKGSQVVTRSGSCISITDLKKCSLKKARSVIILSGDNSSADEADANAVRTCLALSAFDLQGHIVVELNDVDNVDVVKVGLAQSKVRTSTYRVDV